MADADRESATSSQFSILNSPFSIQVLYEDDHLIFVNKPPNLITQTAHDPDEPTLVAEVGKYVSPVYLMQRLDRGTSGVMFFSRSPDINANLTRQFEQKRIRKRYLALCEGELGEKQTIDAPLARIGAIKFGVRDSGKRAVTHISPLRTGRTEDRGLRTERGETRPLSPQSPILSPPASLLAIVLETGRTHQIRVHLAAIGHPLVGDWLYGERNAARPMLHAAELEMTHPKTNQPLRVAAPLPDDFLDEARCRGIVMPRGQGDPSGSQLND